MPSKKKLSTSGFVYIWFDRKHKRYYIGSHWGTENDGYICSSRWMRKAYRRRPEDFKRRVISRVSSTRADLLTEEHRWLSLIGDNELGKRYYNMTKHHPGHWTTTENAKSIGQKISESHNANPNWGAWSKGKSLSEDTKQKLREANASQFQNPEQIEMRREKSKELWSDPVYREIQRSKKLGRKHTPEHIAKRVEATQAKWNTKGGRKCSHPYSEEHRKNLSKAISSLKWFNNGSINIRSKDCPEGFKPGRIKKEIITV